MAMYRVIPCTPNQAWKHLSCKWNRHLKDFLGVSFTFASLWLSNIVWLVLPIAQEKDEAFDKVKALNLEVHAVGGQAN